MGKPSAACTPNDTITANTNTKVGQVEQTQPESPLDKLGRQANIITPAETATLPLSQSQENKSRPRSITILTLLLFLQAVGLFDLSLFFFSEMGIEWRPMMNALLPEPVIPQALSIFFAPLAILALLTGIGFFRLWRTAWIMAMFLQGSILLAALTLYFDHRPAYVYILMLYSIIIIIYLNYSEVYAAFQPASIMEEEEEEED